MGMSEIVRKRRSVRFYTSELISEDEVKKLVEAAIWAPSGHRMYGWRILILQQQEIMGRVKAVSPGLHGNPTTLMILCRDRKREQETAENWGPIGREQEEFFRKAPRGFVRDLVDVLSIMDIAIAAQNICLMATELGIGSCMIGLFDQEAVRGILGLPEHLMPQLFVSLGYRDKAADASYLRSVPKIPMRRSMAETVVGWIRA